MALDAGAIAQRVAESRKYRHLCPDTVLRAARWAADRAESEQDAVKRARRKLHQVYGAYTEGWDPAAVQRELDGIRTHDPDAVKSACARVLALHASTRERMALLDRVYADLFRITGVPAGVLDAGCGLHPFALPWMGLPAGARYTAWDVDRRMVECVGRFLGAVGVNGTAECRDVLATPPEEPADVAFLLKMLPCLEQQERGCSARVIRSLSARHVVASFPTRSIGGRAKGMRCNYARAMDAVLEELGGAAERLDYANEIFYVLKK